MGGNVPGNALEDTDSRGWGRIQHLCALPRLGAQALILAFAAFMLMAIGCTGAPVSPNGQVASISASPFSKIVLGSTPSGSAPALGSAAALDRSAVDITADAAGHALPTCIPGRNKVRVERNAAPPSQAHLQHTPANGCTGLFAAVRTETGADQFSGRTPAAWTHLDLGIVRT